MKWGEFIALIGEVAAGSVHGSQAGFRSNAPHASHPTLNSFRNSASD
jgi:hypothetical protein